MEEESHTYDDTYSSYIDCLDSTPETRMGSLSQEISNSNPGSIQSNLCIFNRKFPTFWNETQVNI